MVVPCINDVLKYSSSSSFQFAKSTFPRDLYASERGNPFFFPLFLFKFNRFIILFLCGFTINQRVLLVQVNLLFPSFAYVKIKIQKSSFFLKKVFGFFE